MCKKISYFSKIGADKALKRIQVLAKKNKCNRAFKLKNSYKCTMCQFWHLTSSG